LKSENDFIKKIEWLGLFDDQDIRIISGTRLDVLIDLMLKKMIYLPHEQDMIIVHVEAVADFPGKGKEKRMATMHVEGIPYGDSAMSRAVALPVAIATRLILEGKIKATGTQSPANLPQVYKPILNELAQYNYSFKESKQTLK
ncbi:saccharopine dehydrogenase C-terminal domain-containing protein, partial [candidate division KSB1 bacterium]